MFSRLLALILCTAVMATMLLALRQKRVEVTQQILALHLQMQQSRQARWDQQVAIAGHMRPAELSASIGRAQLKLEPITPARPMPDRSNALAALPAEPARAP